jgi:hypothetical protein
MLYKREWSLKKEYEGAEVKKGICIYKAETSAIPIPLDIVPRNFCLCLLLTSCGKEIDRGSSCCSFQVGGGDFSP